MKCPDCAEKNELVAFNIGEVAARACEGCHGLWLTSEELKEITNADHAHGWFDVSFWEDHAKLVVSGTPKLCPSDAQPMQALLDDVSNVGVMICNVCKGVWLDRGEYEKALEYIKQAADKEVLDHYAATLGKQIQEVFDGPKHLKDEVADVGMVLKFFRYKLATQYPKLTELLMDLPLSR